LMADRINVQKFPLKQKKQEGISLLLKYSIY
jgi:hypothetical protein